MCKVSKFSWWKNPGLATLNSGCEFRITRVRTRAKKGARRRARRGAREGAKKGEQEPGNEL